MSDQGNTGIKEITRIKFETDFKEEPPKMYRVLLMNNPITDFPVVEEVLMEIFKLPKERAQDVMMKCHEVGFSQVMVGSKAVCEAKKKQAKDYCMEKAEAPSFYRVTGKTSAHYEALEFDVDEVPAL